MSETQENPTVYIASIEIDGRQKYLFESDKLREMLGASLIMDQTRQNAQSQNWFTESVNVFQPASGDLRLWSNDQNALLNGLWKAKHWLTEQGLQHTIAFTTVNPRHLIENDSAKGNKSTDEPTHHSLSWVHRCLSEQANQIKGRKAYPDARPQLALFAQCQIHGQEPAQYWRPGAAQDKTRKDARRGLTGVRAEAKFQAWEAAKKAKFYQENLLKPLKNRLNQLDLQLDPDRSISFQDLSDLNQSEDQYLAFVCADGDGMGKLLENLNWNACFEHTDITAKQTWNNLSPWKRNQQFSIEYDRCVRQAFHNALVNALFANKEKAEALLERINQGKKILLPVLPQLLGGDDLWMVVSREYALEICSAFAAEYAELTQTSPIIQAATLLNAQAEKLTISMGVAFTKSSYPAHYMIQLAEELLKKAKALRNRQLKGRESDAMLDACLDWHWVESSKLESVAAARAHAWTYQAGSDTLHLTSRPWTAAQTQEFIKAAREFQKIPRRKREQLETILRLGYTPSLLAWRSWYQGLKRHQETLTQVIKFLPQNWKTDPLNPWRELSQKSYATPWLDLLQLQHVLGLEGQYSEPDVIAEEEKETAQEVVHA